MMRILLAGVLAAALPAGAGEAPAPLPEPGVINLSCVAALAAIDESDLAGVFYFIPEKDSPAAFADLLVHHVKALKKYVAKVDQDFAAAGGVTPWDHEVLLIAVTLYAGPLGRTLERPAEKLKARMNELSLVPTVSLEAVTAARGRK